MLRFFLLLAGVGLVELLSPTVASNPRSQDLSGALPRVGFVADSVCAGCHKEEADGFRQTAHPRTSQPADGNSILGSFAAAANVLQIANPQEPSDDPHLFFLMQSKGDGFYQTAVAELGERRLTQSKRFDIVIGSGVRGQTYLSWSGNELFELPVSYWTDGSRWINSPGYRDGTANFSRHVDPRCLECHTTFIKALSTDPTTNVYEQSSLVPGITCEVCHGSGARHVADETTAAKSHTIVQSRSILNPARFDRERRVDQCALCHNGTQRAELAPAFSYIPGHPLNEYLAPNPADNQEQPDVHGNQVGLLKRSRCYLSSAKMTCSTCHNEHAPEREPASYSTRCLSCHQWKSCGLSKKLGERISQDCIDCHMPLRETKAIVSVTAGATIRTTMRTHWIKVYPETAPHGTIVVPPAS